MRASESRIALSAMIRSVGANFASAVSREGKNHQSANNTTLAMSASAKVLCFCIAEFALPDDEEFISSFVSTNWPQSLATRIAVGNDSSFFLTKNTKIAQRRQRDRRN